MKRRQFIKKLGAITMFGAVGKLTGDSQSYFKPNPDYVDAPYSWTHIQILPPDDFLLMIDDVNEIPPELIFKHTQPNESQKPTSPTSSL